MHFNKKIVVPIIIAALLVVSGLWWASHRTDTLTSASATSVSAEAASVDLDNGDEDIDWASLPTTEVTLTDSVYEITAGGTYVLTGSSTAGVTVNTDANVRIALNNATIKSTTGAAIAIMSADNTVIQLVAGTSNTVEDASSRSDESVDGTIYSADDLTFTGSGKLTVTANFADAIVSNDDLKFSDGTYVITSGDDGIRGKDSVYIVAGTFTITATGDAIKATNDTDATKGYVYIEAGTLTIKAGDDAIHAEEKVVITGGTIDITTSREGIEGATVTIDGGTINLYASDDGINAPGSTFTTATITFNGGDLTLAVGAGDTDAIDANGDIYVKGGTLDITAPTSSFDYDGTAEMTGGSLTVNGSTQNSIPASHMGGGGRMMR